MQHCWKGGISGPKCIFGVEPVLTTGHMTMVSNPAKGELRSRKQTAKGRWW